MERPFRERREAGGANEQGHGVSAAVFPAGRLKSNPILPGPERWAANPVPEAELRAPEGLLTTIETSLNRCR
jgi:hypothetical protein